MDKLLAKISDYDFDSIVDETIGDEGGYSDNPNDSGKATKYGITLNTAQAYKKILISRYNWDGDMKSLTEEMAKYIYRQEFWLHINGDALVTVSPLIAAQMFDMAVNMGPPAAVTYLQRLLNAFNDKQTLYKDLVPDGIFGAVTLEALRTLVLVRTHNEPIKVILTGLLGSQTTHYRDLVEKREKDEEFFYGWLSRVARHLTHYANLLLQQKTLPQAGAPSKTGDHDDDFN